MARLTPLLALLLVGCAEPDLDAMFTQTTVTSGTRDDVVTAVDDLLLTAEDSVRVALPAGQDTAITDRIVAAWNDGLDVEVTTDFDQVDDPGIQDLLDAGIPVTRTNDGIEYFEFVLGDDVAWDSMDTILSTSFVVVDDMRFVAVNDLGFDHEGTRIILEGRGQDVCDDLVKEHNQLMGNGVDAADATSTTAFDNQAKSIADPRWRYPLRTGAHLEVWFGPQERVTKRIIDAVYAARSDVHVLTDEFANEGLTKALQDKAELGFEVEVVVGPRFGETSERLARLLAQETPDVDKSRVTDERVPTIVLIDLYEARDGWTYPAKAFVLSHDLYSAERLYRSSPVITDQLIDGVLYVFEDADRAGPDDVSDEVQTLVDVFEDHRSRAGGL